MSKNTTEKRDNPIAKNWVVYTYYTENTPYELVVQNLIQSCIKWGYDYIAQPIPKCECWEDACARRPYLLRELMKTEKRNILSLDADAVINGEIIFPVDPYDIALSQTDNKRWQGGTLFLKNNETIRNFLDQWCSYQDHIVRKDDEEGLNMVPRWDGWIKLGHEYQTSFIQQGFSKQWGGRTQVRVLGDEILVLNATPIVEQFYDMTMVRSGKLQWRPKRGRERVLYDLKPMFNGQEVVLVGKGPTLDNIKEFGSLINRCPTVCINESVQMVSKTFPLKQNIVLFQLDRSLKNLWNGLSIVSEQAADYYRMPYIYYPSTFGYTHGNLSAECAISLLKLYGITKLHLIAFDGCCGSSKKYAECIGKEPKYPDSHEQDGRRIRKALGSLSHEWHVSGNPSGGKEPVSNSKENEVMNSPLAGLEAPLLGA